MKRFTFPKRHWLRTAGNYFLVAALSVVILSFVMKLGRADFQVPFSYVGDSLIYGMVIKTTIENGWYLNNDRLGAPAGLRMHDYPLADGLNFLLIKLLSLIRSDYAWVLNVFFLLTFPLTAICAMFAFRQFDLPKASAMVWSLLYTFMPYHFFRGESHLFIATYYLVPLVATVALWISAGAFFAPDDQNRLRRFNFRSRKFLMGVIVCVLASSVGLGYYAFFSCFFLLLGGAFAAVSYRSARHLIPAGVLIAIIFAGLLANLAPNLIYLQRHCSVQVSERGVEEAEVYGLKIAPMVLPMMGHRISSLAALTERYRIATASNESDAAALGVIGTVGFLALLVWLFYPKPREEDPNNHGLFGWLNRLAVMNGGAVLLGTVGGFSTLFALIVTPQMRTYNRISIFIAFFSFLAVAMLLERIFRRYRVAPAVRHLALGLILIIGLLDQTSRHFAPAYAHNQAEFMNDKEFVTTVEQRMPAGAMIFQLPYVPFPENPHVHRMTDYELFRGYLHSRSLRWSYGGMKRREGDVWLRNVSAKPAPEMLEALVFAGFKGIYVDRFGYPDQGAALESKLRELTNQVPEISRNQRLVFFDLSQFANQVWNQHSGEWQQKRDLIMHPLVLNWTGGFSDLEGTAENNWRWCSHSGQLALTNASARPRRVELEMTLVSGYKQAANMLVETTDFSDQFRINDEGQRYSKTVTINPGATTTISFYCDGARIVSPADPRLLIFKVANFKWKEL